MLRIGAAFMLAVLAPVRGVWHEIAQALVPDGDGVADAIAADGDVEAAPVAPA